MSEIDLKREQEASQARERYPYTWPERVFFAMMEAVAGSRTTLSKVLLVELLASIPYRAWELRMYAKLTLGYKNREAVKKALQIMEWSREAQDNEYWHVRAIEAKMREEGSKQAWYLYMPVPLFPIAFYILFTRLMALFNIRRAFLFNAEFEDHAEHIYAAYVSENPQWESEKVTAPEVLERMPFDNWADVFRRIGLDERDHRNNSFVEAGMPEHVVAYEGMPAYP